jgi:Glycosyl transferase family 2/Tetratricopeptide repeat
VSKPGLTIRAGQADPALVSLQVGDRSELSAAILNGLPIATASIASVRCEVDLHTLPQPSAVALLRDIRRVLCPGGRARIISTDLAALIDRYVSDKSPTAEEVFLGRNRWLSPSEMLLRRIGISGGNCVLDEDDLVRLCGLVGLQLESVDREHGLLVAELVRPQRPVTTADIPLVSVLIAAYRPDFLDEALLSARTQTWRNLEIIVGDDCPDNAVGDVVKRHLGEDSRIRYVRHEKPLEGRGRGNYVYLFEQSNGEFIKYLNDDDLLDSGCVERMALCLLANSGVTLVTSHRKLIDTFGNTLPDIPPTRRPVRYDTVIDGAVAINNMLRTRSNWIGEPTTVMFRRSDIRTDEPDLLSFAGLQAPANSDTTLWTHLLSQGDLIYLIDSLSSFRQHDGQGQRGSDFLDRALKAWALLATDATQMGLTQRPSTQLHGHPLEIRPWWGSEALAAIEDADGYVDAGDLPAAIAILGTAVEGEPDDAVIRLYRAQLAAETGDLDAALQDLVAATSASPYYAPAQEQLAALHHEQGNVDGVEAALHQLSLYHP